MKVLLDQEYQKKKQKPTDFCKYINPVAMQNSASWTVKMSFVGLMS